MKALIDVGGGMRDIYGAGVMDCFIDNDIHFDLCIGVSAGGANIASFLAGQKGRNYKFYAEYAARKEYMSAINYLKNGSYMDLDYIYSTLSDEDGENPLDYKSFSESSADVQIAVTDAYTGEGKFFGKKDIERNNYWILKASCAIPIFCKPYKYEDREYVDGGIANPIPVQKAFDMGCDHAVVIIPRPIMEKKESIGKYAKPFLKDYPAVLEKLEHRAEIYNGEIKTLRDYEKQGLVTVISPDSDKGLNMLTTDHRKLTDYYNKAYNDARKLVGKLSDKQ